MEKVYITSQGDMWDKIAYEQMGSEDYMGDLIQCNYHLIDYVIFPSGVQVAIPEIDDTQMEIPSWREGLEDEEDGLDEFPEEDEDE